MRARDQRPAPGWTAPFPLVVFSYDETNVEDSHETMDSQGGAAGDVEEIFIETRPWYGVRHSTTIWCVELNGGLYVGSYGDQQKAWEKNIDRNPEARLAIAEKIYEVQLAPVSDEDLTDALHAAYAAKYDMADVFGDELPQWWYYRVTRNAKE